VAAELNFRNHSLRFVGGLEPAILRRSCNSVWGGQNHLRTAFGDRLVIIARCVLAAAAALLASIYAACAGPCSGEIDRVQARLDARLDAIAGAGPSAPESAAALRHHQPTPQSIEAAEAKLHELPSTAVTVLRAAMMRARDADRAGHASECEASLAQVRRAIGE
jgi:hypothetical protein